MNRLLLLLSVWISFILLVGKRTLAISRQGEKEDEKGDLVSLKLFTKWHKKNNNENILNLPKGHRRLEESKAQYDGFGIHFLHIFFGNPTQKRTLAVTTNGPFSGMPCEDCTDCGERGANYYNFSQSSTFQPISCQECSNSTSCFTDKCAAGRSLRDKSVWSGYEVQDYAFHGGGGNTFEAGLLGTDAAVQFGFPLRFVCQTRIRGFFCQVEDGILSLSPASSSFIQQMFAQGRVSKPRFSLCFQDRLFAQETSTDDDSTGRVTFGGFNRQTINTEMVYAKDLPGDSYKVNITRIHLRLGGGDSVVPLNSNQELLSVDLPPGMNSEGIVDAGYPYVTFDKRFEEPFLEAWNKATHRPFTHATQTLSILELKEMPTLLLELEGDPNGPRDLDPNSIPGLTSNYNVLVALSAEHYMETVTSSSQNRYRNRIQFDDMKGTLLGANLMQGHTVSYEIDKSRIGFAESKSCHVSSARKRSRSGVGGTVGGPVGQVQQPVQQGGQVVTTSTATTDVTALDDDLPPDPVGIESVPTTRGRSSSSSSSSNIVIPGTDPLSVQASTTDDLFVTTKPPQVTLDTDDDYAGGACTTATCRTIMAVGYVFVGTALAVAYRVSRPKDRTQEFFDELNDYNNNAGHDPLIDGTAYRRKITPAAPAAGFV